MYSVTRCTKHLLLAGIILSALFLLYHTNTPAEDRYRWKKTDSAKLEATSTGPELPVSTAPCEGDDCFRGSWKPRRKPFKSMQEVKPWMGCPSPPPAAGHQTEEEQARASAKRLLDVLNWEWHPSNGIMKGFDAEQFAVRLLRSPGGLIIVGDEMSDQYFSSLVVLLRGAGIIMDLQESRDRPYIHSYALRPRSEMTTTLIKEAGVSAARATRPLITFIEDSFLVSVEELKVIAKRVGATSDVNSWTSPFPQADRWANFVENAALPPKGEELSEDTILLMNTGTAWNREIMTLLKPRNRAKDEQTRLTEAYRQMVRTVGNQLQDIPQLAVFYRATTPGHPNCGARSAPFVDFKAADAYERNVIWHLTKGLSYKAKQERLLWDWDLFAVHNDVWRRATARLDGEREVWMKQVEEGRIHPGPKKGKASWRYLEVWNQTLQRPDAHYSPPEDCVNWCSPAIFNQWSIHLNHILHVDAERKGHSEVD